MAGPAVAQAGAITAAESLTGDQQLLRDLIQEGLQCSKPHGNATPERRVADAKRFHALIKVLVRACILDLPAKVAAEGLAATAVQARKTLSIITRNVTLRPEVLLSIPESAEGAYEGAENHRVPLYKWIIPRLLYSASLLVRSAEERELGGQIVQCIVDVIKALTQEQGNGSENIDGLAYLTEVLGCLTTALQGGNHAQSGQANVCSADALRYPRR
jgi:hypothetical protein